MRKRRLRPAVILFVLLAANCSEPSYWPGKTWRTSTPEEQGLDSARIVEMIDAIRGDDEHPVGSLLIVRNGYLVTEAYFHPFHENYRQVLYSCTKSVTSALIGIALGEGRIASTEDRVLDFFPEYAAAHPDEAKEGMTIWHLLTMSTGLAWTGGKAREQDDTKPMIYGANAVRYFLDRPMACHPGEAFNYCNGASHALSAVLSKATGKSALEYAREKLFGPLGIENVQWPADKQGVTFGYSYLVLTPRDMAKLGYLYLRRGRWNGRQIIPERWIDDSTRKQIAVDAYWERLGYRGYGYQWWLPAMGGFTAWGSGGQFIYVFPEHDLLVVFTGASDRARNDRLVRDCLIEPLMALRRVRRAPGETAAILKRRLMEIRRPPAKAATDAPPLARRISGRTYYLTDGSRVTVNFDRKNESVWLWQRGGSKRVWRIGLDDAYRVNRGVNGVNGEEGEFQAMKGRWENGNTFVLTRLPLGYFIENENAYTFYGGEVSIHYQALMDGRLVYESFGAGSTFRPKPKEDAPAPERTAPSEEKPGAGDPQKPAETAASKNPT